jgi:hypothetical protein
LITKFYYTSNKANGFYKVSSEEVYKNSKYWLIECRNERFNLHRLDGAALEYSNGDKYYYYNGEQISVKTDKEFKQYLKMKVFL